MAELYLRLGINHAGLSAAVIEYSLKQSLVKEACHVAYDGLDLPNELLSDEPSAPADGSSIPLESPVDLTDSTGPFSTAMDMVSRKIDLSGCNTAILFVSSLFVSFRNHELPFKSEKKVRQVLPFEIENLLPSPDTGIVFDFHSLDIGEDEVNWILSASMDEHHMETWSSVLAGYGIQLKRVTPVGCALAAAFLAERKDVSSFAFVHIMEAEGCLVLVKDRVPSYVRVFSSAGLTSEQIALLVRQTILGFNQRTGIQNSFDMFFCPDGYPVDDVALENALGSAAAHAAAPVQSEAPLAKSLANAFPVPVSEKVGAQALMNSIRPDQPVKYGFDFCQGKFKASSFFKANLHHIATAVVLLICIVGVSFTSTMMKNAKLNEKISAIDQQAYSIFRRTFPKIKKIQDPYMEMTANVKQALKNSGFQKISAGSQQAGDIKMVGMLGELSANVDPSIDMDISRFLYNSGRLVLSGSTDNFNNVDILKSRIEKSKVFKKVEISSAAADKKEEHVNFKFIIEL